MVSELMFGSDVNAANVFDQEWMKDHGIISCGPLTCRLEYVPF